MVVPCLNLDDEFNICGSVHCHSSNKTTNVMQLGAMSLLFLRNTLHVSGALCTHHQECPKTVNAITGTIIYQCGVSAARS